MQRQLAVVDLHSQLDHVYPVIKKGRLRPFFSPELNSPESVAKIHHLAVHFV